MSTTTLQARQKRITRFYAATAAAFTPKSKPAPLMPSQVFTANQK